MNRGILETEKIPDQVRDARNLVRFRLKARAPDLIRGLFDAENTSFFKNALLPQIKQNVDPETSECSEPNKPPGKLQATETRKGNT